MSFLSLPHTCLPPNPLTGRAQSKQRTGSGVDGGSGDGVLIVVVVVVLAVGGRRKRRETEMEGNGVEEK